MQFRDRRLSGVYAGVNFNVLVGSSAHSAPKF